ncbi:response regulator transcription factor [uncultured Arthrobacter sp.]|uniref:LuxR C-terminal-related transcriptional regulator n=1 Tax=uncultured Arthrobacter sp. TaxID=114050 RepID=UPI00260B2C50|nr:response regulator transcription factor [uncultured Arthrobacter sp.]
MHEITVAVVDDHRLIREGLIALLSADVRIGIGGSGADGFDAIKLALDPQLDVMLLGLDVGGPCIVDVMREIARLAPELKVIILAKSSEPTFMRELLQCGAAGYFVKHAEIEEITAAVIATSRGVGGFVTLKVPRHAFLCVSDSTNATTIGSAARLLSRREQEILALVAQAQSNAQIGRELFITEGTVKRHLSNIFRKLGAVSRIDAVHKGSPSLDRKLPVHEGIMSEGSWAVRDSARPVYGKIFQT